MGDLGLLKQLWNWVYSQRQAFTGFRSCVREKLIVLVDRHWPTVYRVCLNVGRFLWTVLLQWKDCALGGFWSLISLGSVALFVTMWSCFLCLTSMNCLVYALLSVIAAGVTIRYLGYTPGLFIVGLFAILIMWIYGNFWMTGTLLIGGGYMFSLNHARLAILISTTYALYCVNARSGWLGIFLVLNVSSLSNYLLNVLLQGCDAPTENVNLDDEKESESEPVMEECSKNCEYSPSTSEPEHVTSSKASCTTPTPTVSHTQKEAASSEVVRSDSASLEEITRIMTSSTHYEVLGFLLNKVLSDLTKKNSYDEQLRKEEARRVSQKSCGISQKGGGEFISEESRRIQCTKCGNFHTWICTCRSKARARWCQDCSQFHLAKDGDGWVENNRSPFFSTSQKVDIPRAFVCAESKIFDVSEWAICQGVVCRPNTHRPSFMVNMVGLDNTTNRANSSRYPWGLDAEMIAEEDEFDLWLQQALASGLFSETPKRRKSWSPFKIHQKGIKHWRRSP
ncbi:hypothetical protein ACMD2_01802 [Ananas comosus]|uniref:Cleavage inducing molecular chaperone Jiv domain-containing protein n=1 Tax=Ananas comosus TaxID=4615 RepID=A0A199VWN5_ANACO|nr:hypothetical protein ACMD2_01802 [Ananas comosus]